MKNMPGTNAYRRGFLLASILLTLLGCAVAAIGIVLSAWQVVEIREFNAIHEHGVIQDCIRSETIPLEKIRSSTETEKEQWTRKCIYKMDSSAENAMRFAIEEGDASAREMLLHRFLPQHKAVIFFFVFTLIFSFMSMIIAACTACFLPNSIFHVISVVIAMTCSFLGDVIFLLASMRDDNYYVHGVAEVYNQRIGYAFFIHLSASVILLLASICSILTTYFLLRTKWLQEACCVTNKKEFLCESYCQFPSVSFYGHQELETRLTTESARSGLPFSSGPINSTPRSPGWMFKSSQPRTQARRNVMKTFGNNRRTEIPREQNRKYSVPLATEEE